MLHASDLLVLCSHGFSLLAFAVATITSIICPVALALDSSLAMMAEKKIASLVDGEH